MRARVYDPRKRTAKAVTNLGWLLRHWRDVDHFRIVAGERTHMFAVMNDGRIYDTPWAQPCCASGFIALCSGACE